MKFTSLITRWAPTAAAAALVLGNVAIAQCPTDDDASTNDDCASATAVASGMTTGYVVTGDSEDWYTITVPDGDAINVDILFSDAVGDIDAALEGPCGTGIDTSGSGSDNENLSATNTSGAALDYKIRVFLFNPVPADCNDYSLDITVMTPPTCADDSFEPNDDCATPSPITPGVYVGLTMDEAQRDYYSITLADGDQIEVNATFIDADGDIDIALYDAAGCDTFGSQVASSTSSSDNESLSYTNGTGAAQDLILRGRRFGTEFCTSYDLEVIVTTPPACVDDAFEPNEDCATAPSIAAGLTTGLNIDAGLTDWYTISVPAGDVIDVNLLFLDADGDIDLRLEAPCGTFADSSGSSTDNEDASWTNNTGAAVDVGIRCNRFGSELCTPYDLDIAITTPPACLDDAMTNDDCVSAETVGTGSTMEIVTDISDDFYTISVPDGQTVIFDALFIDADGDVDLFLFDDAGVCGNEVTSGETGSDNESVMFSNSSGADVDVTLQVNLFFFGTPTATCQDYELVVTLAETACLLATDDAEEENDTCLTAVVPSANPLTGLFVQKSDMDYYGPFVLADLEEIDVLVAHIQADGDIDARIIDAADCTTVLDAGTSTSDDEALEYVNMTGAAQSVIIQVELWSGDPNSDCNTYDFDVVITPFVDPCTVADDSFEDNDTCATAAPITAGSTTGLFGQKASIDSDWYSIMVADGETLNVDVLHIQDNGDFDVDFFLDCVNPDVAGGAGTADIESVSWMNGTGMAQTVLIHVFIWEGDNNSDCNDYDMDIAIIGAPSPFVSFCFGDGTGAACPCLNEAAMGSGGGCLNADGGSAVLTGSGTVSAAANDIMFNLSGAANNSFALLVSADNQLGGGMGILGMPASDGLRCVGGSLLRHGTRAIDAAGDNLNPWGTGVGIIAGSGFVAGQTRHFQARYRDTAGPCATGTNTTQGVSVTFTM